MQAYTANDKIPDPITWTRTNQEVPIQPYLSVITLGVDDLERAVRFYRDGLGLATEGIVGQEFEHGAVAFLDLQTGLKLAVWLRTSIAHDTGSGKAFGRQERIRCTSRY
ncbi:VOC family protein [Billgrantia endophytica]|uniref:VOC family protein n=1 Tax=Billgrantia endophytica TaxID=2033802 RepID=UPI00197AD0E8|nr:VOC family protein [Halomonas endophytica]